MKSTANLNLRIDADVYRMWRKNAEALGMTLSTYVINKVEKALITDNPGTIHRINTDREDARLNMRIPIIVKERWVYHAKGLGMTMKRFILTRMENNEPSHKKT